MSARNGPTLFCIGRRDEIALAMLRGVVNEAKEDTWLYTDETKEAAWHIAYHAVYYANIYCSPSEEAVQRWPGQSNDAQFLGPTPWLSLALGDREDADGNDHHRGKPCVAA